MPDDETKETLSLIGTRLMAVRHVVARLLAYEANRSGDAKAIFDNVTDTVDELLSRVMEDRPPGHADLEAQEQFRREVDWIVAAAQQMAADDKKPRNR
jgi:hypothetical protein